MRPLLSRHNVLLQNDVTNLDLKNVPLKYHYQAQITNSYTKQAQRPGGGVIRPPSDTMILTGNFSILGTTHPLAYQLVLTY